MEGTDIISHNSCLSACERGSQWQQALQVLQNLSELSPSQPDIITFSTSISSLSDRWS
jgi:hypothetical protein